MSATRAAGVSVPVVAAAAMTAVAFWSLTPVFISVIGGRADYAEVYVTAAGLAVVASSVVATLMRHTTAILLRSGRPARRGALQAAISGFFLSLCYIGYYRALYGTAKVDATIVAYSWPLIAVFAMRLFAPSAARKLTWVEYLLVIGAFTGAAAIGVANLGAAASGAGGHDIVYAFVAAIGSGFYLPFAVNATEEFEAALDSSPKATFYAISLANLSSVAVVVAYLTVTGYTLRFDAFDGEVLAVCALIGLGTYLLAEITWTWAFQEYKSLTLSSLPYFTPAIAVVLLYLWFDEPVSQLAIFGLLLILLSNLSLHAGHRSTGPLSVSLVATVYVALASQVLPTRVEGAVPELAAATTGLFAILAGFVLSRVSGRRTQELDARSTLVRRVLALRDPSGHDDDEVDALLRAIVDLEYDPDPSRHEENVVAVRRRIAALRDDTPPTGTTPRTATAARIDAALDAFGQWATIHGDRLSTGEKASVWITGLGSILFVLLLRDTSVFATLGSLVFAGGAFLVMFTIREYDRNNIHGLRNQGRRIRQGFVELGRDHYVPRSLVESGEAARCFPGESLRTAGADGGVVPVVAPPSNRAFTRFYMATAAAVLVVLVASPLASVRGTLGRALDTPRPGVRQGTATVAPHTAPDVVVGDPQWPAAATVAAVLEQTVENATDVEVGITEAAHDDILRELAAPDGSIDVHPDLWLSAQRTDVRRDLVASGRVHLNEHPYTASEGLYVMDAGDSAAALRDPAALTDPTVARRFDSDGDGLGEVWAGDRGWNSAGVVETMFTGPGHEDWEVETYSEEILRARLDTWRSEGRPALFYGYEPSAVQARFTPRLLSPLEDAECEPERCAPAATPVHVAFDARLAKTHPDAARLLRAVSFSPADISRMIALVEEDGLTPADAARRWLAEHPDRVAAWLREAKVGRS